MIRVKCASCAEIYELVSLEKAYQEFPRPCWNCQRHLAWPGGYSNKSKTPKPVAVEVASAFVDWDREKLGWQS